MNGLVARAEAFLKEFPFLQRYVNVHKLRDRPTVQRIDLDLMDRRPFTERFHRFSDLRFLLIDSSGRLIAEVRQDDRISVLKRKLFLFDTYQQEDVKGETVLEALARIPNPEDVHFIVEIGGPLGGMSLVLHKVPARHPLPEWLANLREIASEELRGELVKVDDTH